MQSARTRMSVACLSGWLGFSSAVHAKTLGFTDNGPYGTPMRERTEKSFALVLPFGVGQFVQGRFLAGSAFLLVEAGLLGASYLNYEMGQEANRQEKNYVSTSCPVDTMQCNPGEINRLKAAVRNADQAMVVLGFSALGAMIGGAVDAVLHERKWSLDIGLTPPSGARESSMMATFDPSRMFVGPRSSPSLILDLKRSF